MKRQIRRNRLITICAVAVLAFTAVACTAHRENSYKAGVERALEQADLKDVNVSEDAGRNTLKLSGKVHSDEAKQRAEEVAKSYAGNRIVVNEVSVEPVGAASEAKDIASNLDNAIEDNYKAALTSNGLNKQHIRYDAKNGVLTLKGGVKTAAERQQAEKLAQTVPNVKQVVNELDVQR